MNSGYPSENVNKVVECFSGFILSRIISMALVPILFTMLRVTRTEYKKLQSISWDLSGLMCKVFIHLNENIIRCQVENVRKEEEFNL